MSFSHVDLFGVGHRHSFELAKIQPDIGEAENQQNHCPERLKNNHYVKK
jgi:hypothetical protein